MATVDLNKSILDYIYECSVVADNPMYFAVAEERNNNNQLLPSREQPQDDIEYVDGTVERTYRAEILMYKSVAYNPIVTQEVGTSGKKIPSNVYLNAAELKNLLTLPLEAGAVPSACEVPSGAYSAASASISFGRYSIYSFRSPSFIN